MGARFVRALTTSLLLASAIGVGAQPLELPSQNLDGAPFLRVGEGADSCQSWGQVYAGAAVLWYRAGDCDARYAVSGASDLNEFIDPGTYAKFNDQYIKGNGAWGYKLFVGVDKEWIDISASYKWWEGNAASATERGLGPDSFLFVPGTAGDWQRISATQRSRYQIGTVWVGVPLGTACKMVTSIHCIARYINLDERIRIDAAGPTFPADPPPNTVGRGLAKSRFQGGGVGFGVTQEQPLPFKNWTTGGYFAFLGIFGQSSMSVSRFRTVPLINDTTAGQDLTLKLRRQNYWVPALEAAALMSYRYTCGCLDLKVRFGWEWNVYFNALYEAPFGGFSGRGRPVLENQTPLPLRDTSHKVVVFGGPSIYLGALF